MDVKDIFDAVSGYTRKNATVLATGTAIATSFASLIVSAKAGANAHVKLEAYKAEHNLEDDDLVIKEKIKVTWRSYVPTAALFCLNTASIITLHKVGAQRTAAAMALYTASETAFSKYRTQVVQKLGEKKHEEVRSAVAQDSVLKSPPPQSIIISGEEVMCYDSYSGHYFKGSREGIREAVNDFNLAVIHGAYASLTDFYDQVGIPASVMSDSVGWTADDLLEVEFSSVISEDGKPCLAVDFRNQPVVDFDRFGN